MTRPLGVNQRGVVESLQLHGGDWHARSGWTWGSPRETVRVLETLRKRGLVLGLDRHRDRESGEMVFGLYRLKLPPATPAPCDECPWRRESAAGWLGPYDAEKWLRLAHSDQAIACHQTVGKGQTWGEEGVLQCRGAAQYRANTAKLPRYRQVAVGPADPWKIFGNAQEFRDHHERKPSSPKPRRR